MNESLIMLIEIIKKCCIFDKRTLERESCMEQVINRTVSNETLICKLKNIDQRIFDAPDFKRDENIHRLFLYPAMMVPATQKVVLDALVEYLPEHPNMLDPYMGSATSLLSCMELGMNVYGQDINPLAVLLSKVKTGPLDYVLYRERLKVIESRMEQDQSEQIAIPFQNINKWFKKNIQIGLSKIRRAIVQEEDIHVRRFFWIVMAEVIRISSNDRTSTYKLHLRTKEDIEKINVSVKDEFIKLAGRSIKDLEKFKAKLNELSQLNGEQGHYKGQAGVRWGNTLESINSPLTFSLLVSSPPYGDNQTTVTYGQHSYLQLQWIDRKDIDENIDFDFLRTTQEIDRKSLGGSINKAKINGQRKIILEKSPALREFLGSFGTEEQKKLNKVIVFIYDFYKSLDVILPKLNKGAFLVWTIGNRHVSKKEVPNDKILIDLMLDREITLIHEAERTILNKTMPSRNKITQTMTKEKILIFQKPF